MRTFSSHLRLFSILFLLIGGGILLFTSLSPTFSASSQPKLTLTQSAATPAPSCTPNVVDYDVLYVRAPRYGDDTNTVWPDTTRPLAPDPGADLRLLHPDCTEELLFPLPEHASIVDAALGDGAVVDPNVSFDGEWVVFSYYHDRATVNPQRCTGGACLSRLGADIYRLHLPTREVLRLTFSEFTPNTGNGANFDCGQNQSNCPRVGTFNVGPAFMAQQNLNKPAIVFTSTRNNFGRDQRALQLFIMDWDGNNVEQIGHLNITQALHPYPLLDGRLMFTTWENQGIRDGRLFTLWFIGPDGTQWDSGSGFGDGSIGHHFMTQMANEDIVTVRYYNLNNNGFGNLVRYPVEPEGPDFLGINEPGTYMPFQRLAQQDLAPWAVADDFPALCNVGDAPYPPVPCEGGNLSRVGKITQPMVAPDPTTGVGSALLLVYTPGSANHNHINVENGLATPYYDGGLYLMPADKATNGASAPSDLLQILNDPAYNEQWPRPVVPYSTLFPGHTQPAIWPDLANDGSLHSELPANTPLGLIGSSSLTWRETDPRPGQYGGDPDPFNGSHEFLYAWVKQGADAGLYDAEEIYAIRLLAQLPFTDRSYPNNRAGFANTGRDERMRIMGEIPVRHEGVIDGNGYTDTSFLARIPADTAFTFQTLDRNGMVLNMAQTWHQLRPGEARYDCGGCHAHSEEPLDFSTTVAGQPGFVPTDVALQTPLLQITELDGNPTTITERVPQTTLEYMRDIRPILETRCAGCHISNDIAVDAGLNLHADDELVSVPWTEWPGTYFRLVVDKDVMFGLGTPPDTYSSFLPPQQTRYLRAFQARESLLIWKVFGVRLDGRTNDTREGDIDYDPAADPIHPNLHISHGLTWDEKLTLARWVDIGAPIELNAFWGWFEDDLRPTLWAAPTLQEAHGGVVDSVHIGAYDLESGLALDTLKVFFNIPIGGQPPGTNLAAGLNPINGEPLTIQLPEAIDLVAAGAVLTVSIEDHTGHTTQLVRTFADSPPPQGIHRVYLPLGIR